MNKLCFLLTQLGNRFHPHLPQLSTYSSNNQHKWEMQQAVSGSVERKQSDFEFINKVDLNWQSLPQLPPILSIPAVERYIPVSPLFSIRDVLSYSLQQKLPSKGIWHKENEEVQLSGRNQTRRAQRCCSLQTQYTREKEHHSAISILPAPARTF